MSEHRGSEFGTAISGLIGIVVLVAVVYNLTAARFSASSDVGTPDEIAARIRPIGSVNLAGAQTATSAVAKPSAPVSDQGPGSSVYSRACAACHATGAANAPKYGDKAAWEPRMAQGVDQLLQTAIAGKGAMPPRGTCMDCSDGDLKAAIEYMLRAVGHQPAGSSTAAGARPSATMSGMRGAPATEAAPAMGGVSGRVAAPGTSPAPVADGSPNPSAMPGSSGAGPEERGGSGAMPGQGVSTDARVAPAAGVHPVPLSAPGVGSSPGAAVVSGAVVAPATSNAAGISGSGSAPVPAYVPGRGAMPKIQAPIGQGHGPRGVVPQPPYPMGVPSR